MHQDIELIPELSTWRGGRNADLVDYLFSVAKSDTAVAYAAIFWPRLILFEGYVLRSEFAEDHLRGWEAGGHSRQYIEAMVNLLLVGDLFPDEHDSILLQKRLEFLGQTLVETHKAKLWQDFPDLRFTVSLVDDGQDFGVTFNQI